MENINKELDTLIYSQLYEFLVQHIGVWGSFSCVLEFNRNRLEGEIVNE